MTRAARLRRRSAAATHGASGAAAPRGFTLLEVMVALALLAGALAAVAELAGQALRNHAYARDVSAATLLARGKLAELEEKYEDSGFKDFDEEEDGDFSEEGRPEVRWKAELVRPDPRLTPEQILGLLGGGEGADLQETLAGLMGAGKKDGASGGPTADTGAATALTAQFLQGQLTVFAEQLKKSFRELRLTVSWPDGRAERAFTVTTHLVVLNPRAPGGSRGDSPDVPPNLAAAAQSQPGGRATPGAPQLPRPPAPGGSGR